MMPRLTNAVTQPRQTHTDSERQPSKLLPIGLVLAAVLAVEVVVLEAPPLIRSSVILLFLGFGPGLGLVGLLDIRDLTQQLVLGMGISLALATLISLLSIYSGYWSPLDILLVLAAITIVAALFQLRMEPKPFGLPRG